METRKKRDTRVCQHCAFGEQMKWVSGGFFAQVRWHDGVTYHVTIGKRGRKGDKDYLSKLKVWIYVTRGAASHVPIT
jgi:hypothetical protein